MDTQRHAAETNSARIKLRLLVLHSPVLLLGLVLSGCLFSKPDPNSKRLTAIDPAQATPDYWWNKPAAQKVACADFDKLWNACKAELYTRLFVLDREQYREGLITSLPLVGKQIFEPWRSDSISLHDQLESTLATVRRTIHFEVTRKPDGTFEMVPKVLIERFGSTERRITSITQYHQAFGGPRVYNDAPDESGDATAAADFWYALRRDANLEKALAESIRNRIGG